MEGQQSLHDPAHPFGSGYFSPAATPKSGAGCCQIPPRSTNRRVGPCEPVCGPPTTPDSSQHLQSPKGRCGPFVTERRQGCPEKLSVRTQRIRRTKEQQDKGLASQVPPARSHLPAVRAVSRRQRRGQNRKENWHLGSGIPEVPVFQRICRGQAPKGGSK